MENPDTHVVHIHGYHIVRHIYVCLRTFIYRTFRDGDQTQVIIKTLNNECSSNTDIATSMNLILLKQPRDAVLNAKKLACEKPIQINNKLKGTK